MAELPEDDYASGATVLGHAMRSAAPKFQTLSETLEELERENPDVRAAAEAYDRTVWRLNMRVRIQLRHLFELMAGRRDG